MSEPVPIANKKFAQFPKTSVAFKKLAITSQGKPTEVVLTSRALTVLPGNPRLLLLFANSCTWFYVEAADSPRAMPTESDLIVSPSGKEIINMSLGVAYFSGPGHIARTLGPVGSVSAQGAMIAPYRHSLAERLIADGFILTPEVNQVVLNDSSDTLEERGKFCDPDMALLICHPYLVLGQLLTSTPAQLMHVHHKVSALGKMFERTSFALEDDWTRLAAEIQSLMPSTKLADLTSEGFELSQTTQIISKMPWVQGLFQDLIMAAVVSKARGVSSHTGGPSTDRGESMTNMCEQILDYGKSTKHYRSSAEVTAFLWNLFKLTINIKERLEINALVV
jgi:hypothetical protein